MFHSTKKGLTQKRSHGVECLEQLTENVIFVVVVVVMTIGATVTGVAVVAHTADVVVVIVAV